MKQILKLSSNKAKDFFLQERNYCTIELPHYFRFQPLLNKLDKKLGINKISSFCSTYFDDNKNKHVTNKPFNFEGVNHILLNNKDGKYAWRPLEVIHPVLYIDLVNSITDSA